MDVVIVGGYDGEAYRPPSLREGQKPTNENESGFE